MKLFKIAAASIALGVSLFANDVMIKNMVEMENALTNIQKGFLYNNLDLVKSGVNGIETTNKIFEDQKATQKYLPENKKHLSNIAYNASKRMNLAADEMLQFINEKEFSKAFNSYSEILNSCNSCHSVVRGW
jgi:cytochrome c556